MKRLLPITLALLFAAALLSHPQLVAAAVTEGLTLCARTVIPSLFPFFAVTALLLRLGFDSLLRPFCAPFMAPLFHLRGECAAPLLAGLLGGYPTGAKAAAELYEQGTISREEGELLLGFCNNCGPGFLLSFVGAGVLDSVRAGVYLFLIHGASALLTGLILCRLPRKGSPLALPDLRLAPPVDLPRSFTASVAASLSSTMSICAYVVLFRTAAAMLPATMPAAALGALEMVSGMAALSPGPGDFVAAAAISAWGGVSVHCQTMAVAGELSTKKHFLGKTLQTAISILLSFLAAKWVYR